MLLHYSFLDMSYVELQTLAFENGENHHVRDFSMVISLSTEVPRPLFQYIRAMTLEKCV